MFKAASDQLWKCACCQCLDIVHLSLALFSMCLDIQIADVLFVCFTGRDKIKPRTYSTRLVQDRDLWLLGKVYRFGGPQHLRNRAESLLKTGASVVSYVKYAIV